MPDEQTNDQQDDIRTITPQAAGWHDLEIGGRRQRCHLVRGHAYTIIANDRSLPLVDTLRKRMQRSVADKLDL